MNKPIHRDWWNQICKKGEGAKAIRKARAFRYMYVVARRFEELNKNTWFDGPTTWDEMANYITKCNPSQFAKKRMYKASGKNVTMLTPLDLVSTSVALRIDPQEFQMSTVHWLQLVLGYLVHSEDNEELDTEISWSENVENFLQVTVPNQIREIKSFVDLALKSTSSTRELFECDSFRGFTESDYDAHKELVEKLQEIIESLS